MVLFSRTTPQEVINRYDAWSRYEAQDGIVIAYGSMYGNTGILADALAAACTKQSIAPIITHHVSKSHLSFILKDIWRYKGVIIGSCVYNSRLFPPVDMLLTSLDDRLMQTKALGIFGTYSWATTGLDRLKDFAATYNACESQIICKNKANEEALTTCNTLATQPGQTPASTSACLIIHNGIFLVLS